MHLSRASDLHKLNALRYVPASRSIRFIFQSAPTMIRRLAFALLFVISLFVLQADQASAQGLIWKLPEDGKWIRFEGQYSQIEARPNNPKGNLEVTWIEHVTIKSVGATMAEYEGEQVPCRWIEFKIQTGKAQQGAIATGPVGERIYKVLIPEKAVIGKPLDDEGIPVMFLPIIDGYRKTNEKDPTPKKLQHGVFNIFPVVSLVRHHKEFEAPVPDSVSVNNADVNVQVLRATTDQESLTERVQHETKLSRSDEMPFGIAQWYVKITHDRKAEIDGRTDFKFQSEITITMTARQIGEDAKSDIVVAADAAAGM